MAEVAFVAVAVAVVLLALALVDEGDEGDEAEGDEGDEDEGDEEDAHGGATSRLNREKVEANAEKAGALSLTLVS